MADWIRPKWKFGLFQSKNQHALFHFMPQAGRHKVTFPRLAPITSTHISKPWVGAMSKERRPIWLTMSSSTARSFRLHSTERKKVAEVLDALLSTVEGFEPKLLLRDGANFVAVFTIKFGDHVIDGMDHMHLNNEGLVDSKTIAWRPLPATVAVQQKLAPKLCGAAMKLVPTDQSF
jgi:hypothetical protein